MKPAGGVGRDTLAGGFRAVSGETPSGVTLRAASGETRPAQTPHQGDALAAAGEAPSRETPLERDEIARLDEDR